MSLGTPGASEIPTDAPLPRDAAGAAALRETLMADAEYTKAAASGDQAKWTTLGYLRWVASGNDPDRWGRPPEIVGDVRAQESDRAIQAAEQHGAVLDRNYDLTAAQKFEVLSRRPVYASEKTKAENEFEKCMRDVAFMERWRNGDRVARTTLFLLNAVKAAPLSRSEADTAAWDAAHPFKE
jgi:hypothetical protein